VTTSVRELLLPTAEPTDPAPSASRREFCARACQAVSLVAVGAFVPACGGGGSPTAPSSIPSGNQALNVLSGSVTGRTVTVPVVDGGPLSAAGGTALVTASIQPGSFLVARMAQDAFTVLTAVCTHESCTVEQFNGQLFVCPCHNSKYTTSGAVANGPAARPLQSFPSTFANGVLSFTA